MSQHEDDLSSSRGADLETGVADEEDFLCREINNDQQAQDEERRKLHVDHNDMADDHELLSYRCILPKDRERIQLLHEEWFPVAYQDDFYDNLVLGKMLTTNSPLYTNLICNKQDEIKACLVGMSVKGSRLNLASRQLLLPDWPHRHERAFYIMTLGTVPEFRHMGLATSLIDELVEQVVQTDQEYGAMYLHVITSNQSAIRFYERLKFWRVKEIESKLDRVAKDEGDLTLIFLTTLSS
jgi:ribosomal protein S18 acetylase RimI-like enzyme